MADALLAIAENTACSAAYYTRGEAGKVMSLRWGEVLHPPKEETLTADEIIDHMKKKLEEVS